MAILQSRRRFFWLAGIVLIVLGIVVTEVRYLDTVTTKVGSLSVVTDAYASGAGQAISEQAADADAIKSIATLRPDVTNASVAASRLFSGVRQVNDSHGQTIYSNTSGIAAWVVEISAPGQAGFARVTGAVILGASDGSTMAASVLMTN